MFYNQTITYQRVVGTEKIIEELPKQQASKLKPNPPKMAFGWRVAEQQEKEPKKLAPKSSKISKKPTTSEWNDY